jgi:hypothetical protein
MQRRVTIALGFAVVALALWVAARNLHAPVPIGHDPATRAGGADDGGYLFAYSDGGQAQSDDSAPGQPSGVLASEPRADGGLVATLPDGTPVPPLPSTAARQVRFGVVLVSYAGAQPSAGGARPAARSKDDAKILAERLAAGAQQDFHGAVQLGDPGSADDLGQVKAGILEPSPEYLLFTLPVGGVAGPVDTPRGYWIVKRLE